VRPPATIGVLAAVTGGFYFGSLITGINRAVREAGGRVCAVQTLVPNRYSSSEDSLRPLPFTSRAGWSRIDGFVSIATAVDEPYLAAAAAAGKPLALVSQRPEWLHCPWVAPDNHGGIRDAVTHLLEHGHRRIGFLGNLEQGDLTERYQAYCATLRRHGIEPDPTLFFPAQDNLISGGIAAGPGVLEAGTSMTALVAGTDGNAVGLMRVLREAGRSVPGDLAVIGFDDTDEASQTDPPLTSVDVHLDRLGELAAALVLRQLDGETVTPDLHVSTCTLSVRSSCGCGPAGPRGNRPAPPSARTQVTVRPPRTPVSLHTEPGAEAGAEVGAEAARRRLTDRLQVILLPLADMPAPTRRRFTEGVEALVTLFDGEVDTAAGAELLRQATAALGALASRPDALLRVVDVVRGYVDDLAELPVDDLTDLPADTVGRRARLDRTLLELTLALTTQEFRDHAAFGVRFHSYLSSQYDVTAALLESQDDPSTLRWMGWTQIRHAYLARWVDGNHLELVGTHGPEPESLLGTVLPAPEFPPTAFLDRATEHRDEVVHFVDVRTEQSPWGVLVAVGPVDVWSLDGREAFNHWAAQLGIALHQQRQREELTTAYHRVQQLAENLRVSEERYALAARTSHDVLWDWDLAQGTILSSGRSGSALGGDPGDRVTTPLQWLGLVHPEDQAALVGAVEECREGRTTLLEVEARLIQADGTYRWTLCRGLAVPGEDGLVRRLVGSVVDIDDRKRLEENLRQGAMFDQLTGLANRALFLERLQEAVEQHRRHPERRFAVLFCDLDGFKAVNDTLGHVIGDRLLAEVAARLSETVRGEDVVARLGGDEFAVLIAPTDRGDLADVVDRLQQAVSRPYLVEGREVRIGVSVGAADGEVGYTSAEDVLRDADEEMYRAKFRHRQSS